MRDHKRGVRWGAWWAVAATAGVLSCGGGEGTAEPPPPPTPVLTSIAFTEVPSGMYAGSIGYVRMQPRDQFGNYIAAPTGSWASSAPGVVLVSEPPYAVTAGEEIRVFGRGAGTAELEVRIGALVGRQVLVVGPPRLRSIMLEAAEVTIDYRDSYQITAQAVNSLDQLVPATGALWSSSDSLAIPVSAEGLVTGRRPGHSIISVRIDTVVAQMTVHVTHPPPYRVSISPATLSVKRNRTVDATVDARDGAGYRLTAWESPLTLNRGLASAWMLSDSTMRVMGLDTGTTTITLTVGEASGSTNLTVVPNPVARIGLSDDSVAVPMHFGFSIITNTFDSDGVRLEERPVRATIRDTTILHRTDGLFIGHAPGTTWIDFTADGAIASTRVRVIPPPTARRLVVPNDSLTLVAGQRARLPVAVLDSVGGHLGDRTVTWESSDPAIATAANGVIRAVAAGRVLVRATADPASLDIPVRVVAPDPVSPFNIDLRFDPDVPDAVVTAMRRAAARWRDAIQGDVPDIPVSLKADECAPGSPAIDETVDDLVVHVRVAALPANIYGRGGPCWSRAGSLLPIVSLVEINLIALGDVTNANLLDALAQHELGHALGLTSTTWQARGLAQLLGSPATTYIGEHGLDGFFAAGGTRIAFGGVPLEDTGGAGTRDTHWRYSAMLPELMTGYLVEGRHLPLSSVTVGALADLGYVTRPESADGYRLPGLSPPVGRPASPPARIDEEVPLRGHIERDGTKRPRLR